MFRNNVGKNPGVTRDYGYGVCAAVYGAREVTITGLKCYDLKIGIGISSQIAMAAWCLCMTVGLAQYTLQATGSNFMATCTTTWISQLRKYLNQTALGFESTLIVLTLFTDEHRCATFHNNSYTSSTKSFGGEEIRELSLPPNLCVCDIHFICNIPAVRELYSFISFLLQII